MLSAKQFRGLKYSFDFRGMNDGNDPYRARLATFASAERKDIERHGVLWEASPSLLEFVQDIAAGRFDTHDPRSVMDEARDVLKKCGLPED